MNFIEVHGYQTNSIPQWDDYIKEDFDVANSFCKIIERDWYRSFSEVYKQSFPFHEQRNEEQQRKAFGNKRYHLIAKIVMADNFKLGSFISYWDFDDYVYIEHLAVNPDMRGKNIGSTSLKLFADLINKPVLLEIDPLVDEVSRNRLHFYERLGYQLNLYKHFHPPYNPQFPPHELLVLSYPDKISEKQYNQFKYDLDNIVMR